MFTQDFKTDFDAVLEAQDPFALVRFGDGEVALIDGVAHKSADQWHARGPSWLRADLIASLRHSAVGWCVGMPTRCCLGRAVRINPAVRVPRHRQTFATLFLHNNLDRIHDLVDRFKDAIVVGSWYGDIRVPADGVTKPWDIDACVAELAKSDRDILLAAGPCSNIIALRYWNSLPPEHRRTVIDVGSALDTFHGKKTRHFHDTMSDHLCSWQMLPSPQARAVVTPRVSTSPKPSITPKPSAPSPKPEATPRPAATRTSRTAKARARKTDSAAPPSAITELGRLPGDTLSCHTKIGQQNVSARPKQSGLRIAATRSTATIKTVAVDPPPRQTSEATVLTQRQMRSSAVLRGKEALSGMDHGVTGEAIAVVVTKRPWLADHVARMLAWQSLRPRAVVVCSAVPQYDATPIQAALPEIPVLFVTGDPDASLGSLRNLAMDHASMFSDSAILCTIDDDDCYGVDYMAGIVDAWQRHPTALVVGLGSFETREVTESPEQPLAQTVRSRAGMRAAISGATISIPSKVWTERQDLRYPDVASGEDIELLQIAHRENRVVGAYIGDFVALRYTDPRHEHTSANGAATAR